MSNELSLKYMLDGMQDCQIVAFNAKGPMGDPEQMKILKRSVCYTVDRLPALRSIIVYAASPNKEKVRTIFQYAVDHGIEIQIPDNMLQSRNRLLGGDKDGCD